jgi:hypothetical protein
VKRGQALGDMEAEPGSFAADADLVVALAER